MNFISENKNKEDLNPEEIEIIKTVNSMEKDLILNNENQKTNNAEEKIDKIKTIQNQDTENDKIEKNTGKENNKLKDEKNKIFENLNQENEEYQKINKRRFTINIPNMKKEKEKIIPKKLDPSRFNFNTKKDNEEKSKPPPGRLSLKLINPFNFKIKEEKPKIIPKKLNINEINQKMEKEKEIREKNKYKNIQEEIIKSKDFNNKLSKFNSSSKEEEEKNDKNENENKITPKKIDMKEYEEKRRASIKVIKKEVQEIKKFDINKHMDKMVSDQTIRNSQDEIPQQLPKKIIIDEFLKKMKDSNKKITIIRKPQKPIDAEKILNDMIKSENEKSKNHILDDEDNFENTNIRGRRSSVVNLVSNLKEKEKLEEERKKIEELRKKRLEERKKYEEEQRIIREEKRKKEEEERKKREEEERKRREEEERIRREKEEAERKRREEEERIRRQKEEEERKRREEEFRRLEEERLKREEEERKKREEEERVRREEERIRIEEEKKLKEEERLKKEEERKKREEEERIRREEEFRRLEEERLKREEEFRRLEEERRKREEAERKKREEEERIRREKEEEERKKREEERRKKEEEERIRREEEEKKRKEEEEKLLMEYLSEQNKKKEDYSESQLENIKSGLIYNKRAEAYDKVLFKNYSKDSEGRNIKYNFKEIKAISTADQILNLEITPQGKIIVLTSSKDISNIIIYEENTYEEESRIVLDSQANSFVIGKDNIYCSLNDNFNNILIISLNNTEKQIYLNGHDCSVTGVNVTNYGYLISADIKGKINVWKDNKIKKTINDFYRKINTICEINEPLQRIAILSLYSEVVKFYDLRYSQMEPLASIHDIKGSGLQNNMLKLNNNILAISGTYIYIIDINSFLLTNKINCVFANDTISTTLTIDNNKGYFFVSQALTNSFFDNIEKGTIGYYEYDFQNLLIPDYNPLFKIGKKTHAHEHFITSIRSINSDTFVSSSMDGKIKFWKLTTI